VRLDADALHDAAVEPVNVPPLPNDALDALPPEQRDTVERLRRMVEAAVHTIGALRDENQRLEAKVRQLEKRPAVPDDATVVTLDDSPEALRKQIKGFIALIDQYLDAGDGTAEGAPSPLSLAQPSSQDEAA
jgi:hypothetical protein